jgi:hypothetical protein
MFLPTRVRYRTMQTEIYMHTDKGVVAVPVGTEGRDSRVQLYQWTHSNSLINEKPQLFTLSSKMTLLITKGLVCIKFIRLPLTCIEEK